MIITPKKVLSIGQRNSECTSPLRQGWLLATCDKCGEAIRLKEASINYPQGTSVTCACIQCVRDL